MAEVTSIRPADLRKIENNLGAIHRDLETLDVRVNQVDSNVQTVYDKVQSLAREFNDYVTVQMRQNRKQVAHTELVRVRQELDKKYGHYDTVRRMTTGILQANDLGVVKKDTISTATEETMISTPGYWLAPCLVALSAWIDDQPDLADRALREGIKRNDEKTSLFFALVCRRVGRRQAALKWTQRYLANQDEENLDRHAVIILDAFASGLLGIDSEGAVARQLDEWLDHLSEKPGFIEQQTDRWTNAINAKRKPHKGSSYSYLEKHSNTWPLLKDVLEGAELHAIMLDYFTDIFKQEVSTDSLKAQLDEILNSLVSDFDDEELPLRREEMFNQLIIDNDGDEQRAKQQLTLRQSALEEHKDFMQLLTDAAMNPEESHASPSTQKFSIALSRDWIVNAYNDITAQNRMKVPNDIAVNIDTFSDSTTDGQNESAMIARFEAHVEKERMDALSKCVLSSFEMFALYGGATIAAVGLLMFITGNTALGIIALIGGIGLVLYHFSKKKTMEQNKEKIAEQFDEKKTTGVGAIRAVLAEVVDYRSEFSRKDAVSTSVIDFLEQVTPQQYLGQVEGSTRRINAVH